MLFQIYQMFCEIFLTMNPSHLFLTISREHKYYKSIYIVKVYQVHFFV